MAVDLEEAAQLDAVVAAPEPVGAEHAIAARDVRPDLLGEGAHVVGRGDGRAAAAGQALLDVGTARRPRRGEGGSAGGPPAGAAPPGGAGGAPHLRGAPR